MDISPVVLSSAKILAQTLAAVAGIAGIARDKYRTNSATGQRTLTRTGKLQAAVFLSAVTVFVTAEVADYNQRSRADAEKGLAQQRADADKQLAEARADALNRQLRDLRSSTDDLSSAQRATIGAQAEELKAVRNLKYGQFSAPNFYVQYKLSPPDAAVFREAVLDAIDLPNAVDPSAAFKMYADAGRSAAAQEFGGGAAMAEHEQPVLWQVAIDVEGTKRVERQLELAPTIGKPASRALHSILRYSVIRNLTLLFSGSPLRLIADPPSMKVRYSIESTGSATNVSIEFRESIRLDVFDGDIYIEIADPENANEVGNAILDELPAGFTFGTNSDMVHLTGSVKPRWTRWAKNLALPQVIDVYRAGPYRLNSSIGLDVDAESVKQINQQQQSVYRKQK